MLDNLVTRVVKVKGTGEGAPQMRRRLNADGSVRRFKCKSKPIGVCRVFFSALLSPRCGAREL
jgi:hypothetical protein